MLLGDQTNADTAVQRGIQKPGNTLIIHVHLTLHKAASQCRHKIRMLMHQFTQLMRKYVIVFERVYGRQLTQPLKRRRIQPSNILNVRIRPDNKRQRIKLAHPPRQSHRQLLLCVLGRPQQLLGRRWLARLSAVRQQIRQRDRLWSMLQMPG